MAAHFKATQDAFSAYIKDPENNPHPTGIKQERMETYRQLFFNNVESFLSSNFPVIKAILADKQWEKISYDFYAAHSCTTPYFSEIPEEFIAYLQNTPEVQKKHPFLIELAHYEWVEMALSVSQEELTPNPIDFIQNLAKQTITLSPLAWSLAYQYPVQQISPNFLPTETPQSPTYLLVYRNTKDEVNFIQTPFITFRLLQIIQENNAISCSECLKQIAKESAHPEPDKIIASGLQALTELAEKNIIQPYHSV